MNAPALGLERSRILTLEPGTTIVLRAGTLLDGRGGIVRDALVWIVDGRIAEISTGATDAPVDEALVVDASRHWVLPGLIDAHLQLVADRDRRDLDQAGRDRAEGLELLETALQYEAMLSAGVTTVRTVGGEPRDAPVALRLTMLEGVINGPRILTAGGAVLPEADTVAALKRARRNFGEGADLVMLGDERTERRRWRADELRTLLGEARRRGVKIGLRAISADEAREAADGGLNTLEGLPRDSDDGLLATLAERGTHLVPLLQVDRATSAELIRRAAERGVPIAAGSGWTLDRPAATLCEELQALAEAGLPPEAIVQAATSGAAAALGLDQDVGSLEVGKLAELVVLDADPLRDPSILGDPPHVVRVFKSPDPLTM